MKFWHLGLIGIGAGIIGTVANLFAGEWRAVVWALASGCWAAAYAIAQAKVDRSWHPEDDEIRQ